MTTIVTAVGLFVATNLDDIVVLTVLFVASTRGGVRARSVVAGQYLGFVALVALSVVAALGLTIVPDQWVGLLGFIPMAMGIIALVRARRHDAHDDEGDSALRAGGFLGVAGITFANGGDNIAIYTPVFRTMSSGAAATTIGVFLVMVAIWCAVGRLVGTRPAVAEAVGKVENWLVPAVFIGLGLFILIDSGILTHIFA